MSDVQARLDEVKWYHTIDVVPGATTKGWFDLRHALPLIPWPDVAGKRCLDVGTWDGFYAYELERRGAAEVVALDVADLSELDYPPEIRASNSFDASQSSTQRRPIGFELLNEILGSSVQWRGGNVYDLDPAEIGTFDVVVAGSLLLHLRDPVRALEAIRRVTSGVFMSIEYVNPLVNILARKRALFELRAESADFQWWIPSEAGLRRMLHVAGFTIQAESKRFLLRGGRQMSAPSLTLRQLATRLATFAQTRDPRFGHIHRAFRARPRFP